MSIRGFTKGVFSKAFPALARTKDLQIVYPCVDVNMKIEESADDFVSPWNGKDVLLSINRFEKKKDIGLAIKAYAGLGSKGRKGVRLVVAGLLDVSLDLRISDGRQVAMIHACQKMCHTTKS